VQDANFALASGTFFTLLAQAAAARRRRCGCIAGLNGRIAALFASAIAFFDHASGTHVPLNLRNIGMAFPVLCDLAAYDGF
jgi:hypothetical protein